MNVARYTRNHELRDIRPLTDTRCSVIAASCDITPEEARKALTDGHCLHTVSGRHYWRRADLGPLIKMRRQGASSNR